MTAMHEPAIKDEHSQRPVASAWRPTLCNIVEALVQKNYGMVGSVGRVDPIPRETAERIESYIADYGETLTNLPEDAWNSSVSQWMGAHWDVLVDLFTEESGESDLVLHVRVFEHEKGTGYRYEVVSVHVP